MTRLRGQVAPEAAEHANEAGLRVAFEAHGAALYGLARRCLGEPQLAEEVVQETFLRAWRARARFDSELGTLRAWLFAIARNVVVDTARSRGARPSVAVAQATLEDLEERSHTFEDPLEHAMRGWAIEEALRRLRPEHRLALVEVYYRGRPAKEVAASTGVPEGTIRSRCYYGLRALRLTLEEMGFDDDV